VKLPATNPFGDFRTECEDLLQRSVKKILPSYAANNLRLTLPPTLDFGDLASSLCFELAQAVRTQPTDLAQQIVEDLRVPRESLIRKVESAGGGYINFYADYSLFSQLTLASARTLGLHYGYVTTPLPLTVIVEHTSVNPAGPIHVGTARNSILGDALYRLNRARGHDVSANFYVDDVGRQIAVLVYGFQRVRTLPRKEKIDHWLGLVYAATSCIIEIEKLKQVLRRLRASAASEAEVKRAQTELDDWVSAAGYLCEQDASLFYTLLDKIKQDPDPEGAIATIMQSYERGDRPTKQLVRHVVDLCLAGFKETYDRVQIAWDSWDWESDLVWDGAVTAVITQLKDTPYCALVDDALEFNAERAARELNIKPLLGIPPDHEIPSLVLNRSDGTTLYSTRDIAYSLWKLNRAERVINVIGREQALAQTQIRIALSVLTSPQRAMDMLHYAYEFVTLPEYRMSKRRGRYVTFDEILDEAEKRARREVETRSPHLPDRDKDAIAKAVGGGAVKYALISIAPTKQVVFQWDTVLNFDTNSAPFIQYAYARAANILKKAGAIPNHVDYRPLQQRAEHELVRKIARFPEVFVDAAENLAPNSVAEFANDLSAAFNSFYASLPVLKAETPELRTARLALVDAVKLTLRNAVSLLGIDVLERM
jgi:arginyl-tRNA synthetase